MHQLSQAPEDILTKARGGVRFLPDAPIYISRPHSRLARGLEVRTSLSGAARTRSACSNACCRRATTSVCCRRSTIRGVGALLGNFPQALSHLAVVNSAYALREGGVVTSSTAWARWLLHGPTMRIGPLMFSSAKSLSRSRDSEDYFSPNERAAEEIGCRGEIPMGARAVNAVLGAWLFASAFIWHHTYAQTENAWVVGFLAAMMAMGGLAGLSWTRYLNVILGIWLILSPLFVRVASPFTYWNDELVGAALIIFGIRRSLRRRRPAPSSAAPVQPQ